MHIRTTETIKMASPQAVTRVVLRCSLEFLDKYIARYENRFLLPTATNCLPKTKETSIPFLIQG